MQKGSAAAEHRLPEPRSIRSPGRSRPSTIPSTNSRRASIKTSKQLADIQTQQQNMHAAASAPAAAPGAPLGRPLPIAPARHPRAAPPPGAARRRALQQRAARLQRGPLRSGALAVSGLLKYYPTTDLAGNAQFYIADIEYHAGNYEAAVADYDKVLEQFPGGNKAACSPAQKGILTAGTRPQGCRYPRIERPHPALSPQHRSHPGARAPAQTGRVHLAPSNSQSPVDRRARRSEQPAGFRPQLSLASILLPASIPANPLPVLFISTR